MPFKKKRPTSSRRKRPTRTSTRKPKQNLGLAVAKTVGGYGLKLLKARLGLNTETNFLDTVANASNIATTLTVGAYALAIPQGDTSSSRTAAGIRLSAYEINLTLLPQGSAAQSNPGSIRVIVYGQKKAVNGTLVSTAQILQDNTNIRSPYNMDQSGYQILYDRTYGFNASVDAKPYHTHISVPLGLDWHLQWTNADTTGSSANLQAGYIRIAYMYEGFTAVTGIPQIASYTRVKWVDN